MKHLSLKLLAEIVDSRMKALGLSQAELSKRINLNQSILFGIEKMERSPTVDQLLSLSDVLGFELEDVIVDDDEKKADVASKRIAVAGTGYVGLSLAVLLSGRNDVLAVDIDEAKVEKIND